MKTTTSADLGSAAIVSFILVLPFVVLEAAFNPASAARNAPDLALLFGLLWLLLTAFVAGLRPLVRNVRAGRVVTASPANLLLRVAFLAVVATACGSLLADQMPCFLGVPNCD